MNTWNPNANDVFLHALELGSARERRQYLDAVCAGDDPLRAEVEALLAAGEPAGSFLESPAVAPALLATVEQPVAERPGAMIGPYKLLEQIGEGGFGVVFMAEQLPRRRKSGRVGLVWALGGFRRDGRTPPLLLIPLGDKRPCVSINNVMRPTTCELGVFQFVIHVPAVVFQYQLNPV